MNLSNLKGFPQALYDAIKNDPYDKGLADFSITELLKPPRQRVLQLNHAHEIEEDVEDKLYALYGQVAHLILERANRVDLSEKRFFMDVGGYKISGQIDTLCLEDGTLSDFKFTTSWGFLANQDPKPEWVAQLNMQLELLRSNGLDAKRLQIIGLLRDHQKSKAKEDPNYPSTPIAKHEVEIWSRNKTTTFMRQRIRAHTDAFTKLPLCTPDERWAKGESWAIIKPGQKRAVKVFYERPAAFNYAEANGLTVQSRPSDIGKRCESYCSASKFCQQYQILKREEGEKRNVRKQGTTFQTL